MPLTIDQRRKLVAKRHNEHVKLIATGFNTGAVASTIAVVLVPAENKSAAGSADLNWLWVALGLLATAHVALRLLRGEE